MILHATTIAIDDTAALITGASGSGKSTLALALIALGATLVADDRTVLTLVGETLTAAPPETLAGRIEARGTGLLTLPHTPSASVAFVIDMDAEETERLPPPRLTRLEIGPTFKELPLFRKVPGPGFAPAILLMLRHPQPDPRPT